MASRLRSPIALAPIGRCRPLSRQEIREARAIRLAMTLLVVAVHAEGFMPGQGPLPDDMEERWAWLRTTLAPLAGPSPTVRAICRILDPQHAGRVWYTRPALDRQITQLRRRVRQLARQMGRPANATSRR